MTGCYDQLIKNACNEYLPDYDHRLLKAQCFAESSFNHDAVSPVGAMGLMQIMPGTWDDWKLPRYDNPYDPEQSLMTGARYMAWLISEWSWPRPELDRTCLALAAYNAGLKQVLDAQTLSGGSVLYSDIIHHLPDVTGSHAQETMDYVRKILMFYCGEVTGL